MALPRSSSVPSDADSFFETEKARLLNEISSGIEDLITTTNVLNRKIEEVHGVGKEFSEVAKVWGSFQPFVTELTNEPSAEATVPGTGGTNFGASVAAPRSSSPVKGDGA